MIQSLFNWSEHKDQLGRSVQQSTTAAAESHATRGPVRDRPPTHSALSSPHRMSVLILLHKLGPSPGFTRNPIVEWATRLPCAGAARGECPKSAEAVQQPTHRLVIIDSKSPVPGMDVRAWRPCFWNHDLAGGIAGSTVRDCRRSVFAPDRNGRDSDGGSMPPPGRSTANIEPPALFSKACRRRMTAFHAGVQR